MGHRCAVPHVFIIEVDLEGELSLAEEDENKKTPYAFTSYAGPKT
jgi:hypothetical protein